MTLLRLSCEFFFIGLFSVGGGMATVPFLVSLSERSGWFSLSELSNIIALSQASPGPIGINMATYVGHEVSGVAGALVASVFLTLPAFLMILLLSKLIARLRGNRHFEAVFAAIRPASIGLIAAVLLNLCSSTFLFPDGPLAIQWKSIVLFLVISAALFLPKLKRLPIPVFLLFAAVCGIVFRL